MYPTTGRPKACLASLTNTVVEISRLRVRAGTLYNALCALFEPPWQPSVSQSYWSPPATGDPSGQDPAHGPAPCLVLASMILGRMQPSGDEDDCDKEGCPGGPKRAERVENGAFPHFQLAMILATVFESDAWVRGARGTLDGPVAGG